MSKKGFTLVELLAAMTILALLMGIAAISYTAIVEKSMKSSFKAYESTMKAQAMEVLVESVTNNGKNSLIPANHQSITLYLSDLHIDPFVNPKNKSDTCPNSYVKVTREDTVTSNEQIDAFDYKVCLICPDSDYVTSDDCLGN